jgi:hypothetical protein
MMIQKASIGAGFFLIAESENPESIAAARSIRPDDHESFESL